MPKLLTEKEILTFCDPSKPEGTFKLGCTLAEYRTIMSLAYTALHYQRCAKTQAKRLRECQDTHYKIVEHTDWTAYDRDKPVFLGGDDNG